MQELPIATVTVRFARPVTGNQIAALVQQIANEGRSRFVVDKRYYDGEVFQIGQSSGYPYDHIRVVPSLDGMPYFALTENYSEVKVTSHSWQGSVYAIGYSDSAVVEAVKKFAARMYSMYTTALEGGFPQFDASNGSGPEGFVPGFDDC